MSHHQHHHQHQSNKTMTSAIKFMSVADVRKGLMQLRKAWSEHSEQNPIWPSKQMNTQPPAPYQQYYGQTTPQHNLTFEQFALHFVMGHHNKRHDKSKHQQRQLAAAAQQSKHNEDEDDVDDEQAEQDNEEEQDDMDCGGDM